MSTPARLCVGVRCSAPPRYEVMAGAVPRRVCGRHLAWLVQRVTAAVDVVTVRVLLPVELEVTQ